MENIYIVKIDNRNFLTSTYKKAVELKRKNKDKIVTIDTINLKDLNSKDFKEIF